MVFELKKITSRGGKFPAKYVHKPPPEGRWAEMVMRRRRRRISVAERKKSSSKRQTRRLRRRRRSAEQAQVSHFAVKSAYKLKNFIRL
jgi:hypothetical protein